MSAFAPEVAEHGPTRPVLRWHGGKWVLAPWIISNLPPHRVYVEPFGGAASVLLRKVRSYAEVYNDLDGEVVNLFRVLRSSAAADFITALRLTPFAREEFEEAYEPSEDPFERARRLTIRCMMGFGTNGHHRVTGFRANSNRSGSTPARDWRNYPDALAAIVDRFRGVVIEHRPASEVIAAHDGPETLFYVDPPYVAGTRDGGTDYAHEMSDDDHAELLGQLVEVKGAVVLSGYSSALYDDALLPVGWKRIERAAFADGARARVECLWLNRQAHALGGLFAEVAAE